MRRQAFPDVEEWVADTRRKRKRLHTGALLQVVAFFLLLFVLAFCSLLFFLRPSYSALEKRELAKFPTFSVAALLNGSFFDDINTWFADTFPFREGFLSVNNRLKSHYGIATVEVHGDVEIGDEIPDIPPTPAEQVDAVQPETSESSDVDVTELPTQDLGAVLVAGDAAYEYYNFVQSTANLYTGALNRLSGQLAGQARIYDMVIPTSIDIMLPATLRSEINSSDQKKAIAYLYGSLSSDITPVEVYDALSAAQEEYIYFRTDHHWTAKGAYVAYQKYATAAGFDATPLSAFTEVTFDGFLGSFYADTGMNAALGSNPDVVYAYQPEDTNQIEITDQSGSVLNRRIIQDVSDWTPSSLYSTFIGGDNPLSVITNPNLPEGDVCVVVKESYGNAFIPFLVGNYRQVYVVDYRYFRRVREESLAEFVQSVGATDVLVMNNVSATRSSSLMQYFNDLIG